MCGQAIKWCWWELVEVKPVLLPHCLARVVSFLELFSSQAGSMIPRQFLRASNATSTWVPFAVMRAGSLPP
jgi:hypothetical protein